MLMLDANSIFQNEIQLKLCLDAFNQTFDAFAQSQKVRRSIYIEHSQSIVDKKFETEDSIMEMETPEPGGNN